jgi:HEPN domain-containing protein
MRKNNLFLDNVFIVKSKVSFCKYAFVLLFSLFAWHNSYSQEDCSLSTEQEELVGHARKAISTASERPNYENHTLLVNKVSKALEAVPDCPELNDFYKVLISTYYHSLAKERGPNELFFYQQAMLFSEKYLQVLTDDPLQTDTYTRFLKDIKEEYAIRERVVANAEKRKFDDEMFEHANKNPTIENYRKYLDAFPEGAHVKEAKEITERLLKVKKEKDDNDYFEQAVQANTKDSYQTYLIRYPKGLNADKAKKAIATLEEEEAWNKIKNAGDIALFKDYMASYPNGIYFDTAKQKIASLYAQSGIEDMAAGSYESALKNFKSSLQYQPSKEVEGKISEAEEELLYAKIKKDEKIEDGETYLKKYSKGKYIDDVKDKLCLHYFQKGNALYKEDRDAARTYYAKVSGLGCSQKENADSLIKKIDRKNN